MKCSCNHLTSFALIMDVSEQEVRISQFLKILPCTTCMPLFFIIFADGVNVVVKIFLIKKKIIENVFSVLFLNVIT